MVGKRSMEGKKILVVRNDKIGDMVLSSGIFRAIKKISPNSEIIVIASKVNKELIEANPAVDKIKVLDYSPRTVGNFISYLKMALKLRRERIDVGIELRGSFFNIFFLLFLGGICYRIGLFNQSFGRYFLHKSWRKNRSKYHSIDVRRDILKSVFPSSTDLQWPDIALDSKDLKIFREFARRSGLKKYICVVPEASNPSRQWPLEKYILLIEEINFRYPKRKIVLVGIEKSRIDSIKRDLGYVVPFFKKPLRVVYLLFKNSSLVIAPDGGPMHLAWASKTPTVSFTPRHLAKWAAPLGENSRAIIYDRIEDMGVEQVLAHITKLA